MGMPGVRHDGPRCPTCGGHIAACQVWIRQCVEPTCRKLFVGRSPRTVTCGPACSRRRRNRSNARTRWKHHRRRSAERLTDITPAEQDALTRRTRKCKLCGVWMTSKPFLPNSKELDHIVPINTGGTHTHGNVRIICRTCNLKRPKNGSDYTGQTTLWATAPGVAVKPSPAPKPQRPSAAICACGNAISSRTHGLAATRCSECLVKLAQQAADLRRWGWKWEAICRELGYSNTGSLFGLVKRYARDREEDAECI